MYGQVGGDEKSPVGPAQRPDRRPPAQWARQTPCEAPPAAGGPREVELGEFTTSG